MGSTWQGRAFGDGRGAIRAILILVVVAVVVGVLTAFGQQYLPGPIRSLANAAAPWFFAILIAVRVGRRPLALSIILAVGGFILLNSAYGAVTVLRGYPYPLANIWTIVAIPAGVLVGCVTAWLDSRHRILVVLAVATPAVVLLAEGTYGLTVVLRTTGPVVWILELVAAAAWVAWTLLRHRELGHRASAVRSPPAPRWSRSR